MSSRALLTSVLLLASIMIIHGLPLVSPRDDQQPQVVPSTGVDPSDPPIAHGPDGLHPIAAATAMVIATQSNGQDAPGTILTPYEQSTAAHPAPTHRFVSPASTLTSHGAAPHSRTPALRTSQNTPDVSPAPQSSRSERNILTLAIIIGTIIGLLVVFTIGKYIFAFIQEVKRKRQLSQQSREHQEEPPAPANPDIAAQVTDTEAESLRAFSFPARPGRKAVRLQDPNEVPSEPVITNTRLSTSIASSAFRQSNPDHDSIITEDTASTVTYLFKASQNTQGDHLLSDSAPVTDTSSVCTIKPTSPPKHDKEDTAL